MRINDIRIVFVGGIHGVGKTHFSDQASKVLGVPHLNASTLIAERRKAPAAVGKRVQNVEDNQAALVAAIESHSVQLGRVLLDGHFCLLDAAGSVVSIPIETFRRLAPVAVVVLLGDIEVIQQRLRDRDRGEFSINLLSNLQSAECTHAETVCSQLNIPMCLVRHASEHSVALEFMARHINTTK